MILLPDVNLLLYAYDRSSNFHSDAAKWLSGVLSGEQVFFTWQTITGFLRIVTNPVALAHPLTIETATEVVDEWLELDNTHIISFEKRNWKAFASILRNEQASGNLVMDALIAASASASGATIASLDRDFSRFSGVQTINPLKT